MIEGFEELNKYLEQYREALLQYRSAEFDVRELRKTIRAVAIRGGISVERAQKMIQEIGKENEKGTRPTKV